MKEIITYHIWLGYFKSKEDFYQYTEIDYCDDDQPMNRFIQDQGQLYYDEDFGESEFFDASFKDVHKFITLFSYGDQFVDELIKRAYSMKIIKMNALIMLELGELNSPQTVINQAYEVHYMGTFIVSTEPYEQVK